MTLRLSMIAAALFLFSSVAQASDITNSTDDARARAAVTSGAGAAVSAVAASRSPASTDEARVVARVASQSTAAHPLLASSTPSSTDEARALAAGGLLAVTRPAEQKTASACTCKHG